MSFHYLADTKSAGMITRPSLLLDEKKCRRNIESMAKKAAHAGIRFRPHFKTHQSHIVGRWFREAGTNSITVSSVQMAEYFISDGWKDITIAFPFNILETTAVNNFPIDINIQLVVESAETAEFIGEHLRKKAGIFIKIDTGYGRTGVKPDNLTLIEKITSVICRSINTEFLGFLAHNGHTYQAKSPEEILKIHNESVIFLNGLRDYYPQAIISIGDTPSCSLADDFSGVDEIRPGNFVFYDWMQVGLGSCRPEQVAVALACPVVAVHPARNEVVIHGGAVHLSKEFITENGQRSYGQAVIFTGDSWDNNNKDIFVKSVSQEHGVLHVPAGKISRFRQGGLVAILPVHSCLTANLMKGYILTGSMEKVDHASGKV